jgi:hypothetical protein
MYHESFSLDSSLLSRQENVALKGTATQSSTYTQSSHYAGPDSFFASTAIDGGSVALDQTTADKLYSMAHTHEGDEGSDAWWKLELDQDYIISQVIIFNRSDCCTSKIRGFVLEVLDKDDIIVFTQTDPATYADTDVDTPLSFVIDIDPDKVGKKVRISLPSGSMLQLQEVMVFGVVPEVSNQSLTIESPEYQT